jgi:hypothetical protein
MEQEQFFYNLFMAQDEKRRVEKKAAKTKQIPDGRNERPNSLSASSRLTAGINFLFTRVFSWR